MPADRPYVTDFTILRQSGMSRTEENVAAHYALLANVPIMVARAGSIDEHADALRSGMMLPIGTVEFIRQAMALADIPEPANLSYPECLRRYLRRALTQRPAGSVLGRWFIKPTTTKTFTGFVIDTLADADHLTDHDREQHDAFLRLPPETPVWVSEPVVFHSEYRYYVANGKILGDGRYDDGPDESPAPDPRVVQDITETLAQASGAPIAFGIDVGVLESGETALVECNDAWALGYYKGSLSHDDYIGMLWARWQQLAGDSLESAGGA